MLAIVQENAENHPSAANGMFMMVSFTVRSLAVVVVGAVGDMAGMETCLSSARWRDFCLCLF